MGLFSRKTENGKKERRRAYRVAIKNLIAAIRGKSSTYRFPVKDVSVTGVGILAGDCKAFAPGILINIDIIVDRSTVLSGVMAKVVRNDRSVVGCRFEDLTKEQEGKLHELVLAEQKRQAAARKKSGAVTAEDAASAECVVFVDPWSKKKSFFNLFPNKDKK